MVQPKYVLTPQEFYTQYDVASKLQNVPSKYQSALKSYAYGVYYQQNHPNPDAQYLKSVQGGASFVPQEYKKQFGNISAPTEYGAVQKPSIYTGGYSSVSGGESSQVGQTTFEAYIKPKIKGGFTPPIGTFTTTYSQVPVQRNYTSASNFSPTKGGEAYVYYNPKNPFQQSQTKSTSQSYTGGTFYRAQDTLTSSQFQSVLTGEDVDTVKKLEDFFGPRKERLRQLDAQGNIPTFVAGGATALFELGEAVVRPKAVIYGAGRVIEKYSFLESKKSTLSKADYLEASQKINREVLGVDEFAKNPLYEGGKLIVTSKAIDPFAEFASRPLKNVIYTAKNDLSGIVTGTVKGSPEINYVSTPKGKFLFIEDIHTKNPLIPNIGDVPLKELVSQTKAGTGKKVGVSTFVTGPLSELRVGGSAILRRVKGHYGGLRSATFYGSPNVDLVKNLEIVTNRGETIILPKGTNIGVASKQFSSSLLGSTTYGVKPVEFRVFPEKNRLFYTEEKVGILSNKGPAVDVVRSFYSKEQSGKFLIAKENITPRKGPVSVERQVGAQEQGVFPYKSRGSKALGKDITSFYVFEKKKLPNILSDVRQSEALQKTYEDIGFGRVYKKVSILDYSLKVPVGRPPNLSKVAERPRGTAVIQDKAGKYLFVQEGKQKLLFPGGGVEPILVPAQGTKGISKRLVYPKNFGSTATRETFEETGMISFGSKRIPVGKIKGKTNPLNPLIAPGRPRANIGSKGAEPAYLFKDIATFYKVKPILQNPKPKGEIDRIFYLSKKEALARNDIGSIERAFLSGNKKDLLKVSSLKNISVGADKSFLKYESEVYSPKKIISFSEESKKLGYNSLKEKKGFYDKYNTENVLKVSKYEKYFLKNENRDNYLGKINYEVSYNKYRREPFKVYEREKIQYNNPEPITEKTPNEYTPNYYRPPSYYYPKNPYQNRYPSNKLTEGPKPNYKYPSYIFPKFGPPRKESRIIKSNFSRSEPGFFAVIFKKGKPFKALNSAPLTKRNAISLGANFVNQSIKASFKIIPAGARAINKKISGPTQILRPGKRDKSLFVEKSRYRINTPGEKLTLRVARQGKKNSRRGFF